MLVCVEGWEGFTGDRGEPGFQGAIHQAHKEEMRHRQRNRWILRLCVWNGRPIAPSMCPGNSEAGKDGSEEGGQILQTSASPLGEVKDAFPGGETCRFLFWRDILLGAGHTGLTREKPLMSWGCYGLNACVSPHVDALIPSGMVSGGGAPTMAAGPLEETGAHARPCAHSKDGASQGTESVGIARLPASRQGELFVSHLSRWPVGFTLICYSSPGR